MLQQLALLRFPESFYTTPVTRSIAFCKSSVDFSVCFGGKGRIPLQIFWLWSEAAGQGPCSTATFKVFLVGFRRLPAVFIWCVGIQPSCSSHFYTRWPNVVFFCLTVNVTQRSVSWIITLELDWMRRFLWISTTNVMSTQRSAGGFFMDWPLAGSDHFWPLYVFMDAFEASCLKVCWIITSSISSASSSFRVWNHDEGDKLLIHYWFVMLFWIV